ncbi:hypothetical protein DFR70_113117 [Nocardia tenerifensis]|uniref:Subtilisin inhibitor-like n=1 Tax=Nocardia tenerifensis TaxID=228006 RepID=A0A318JS24_9NOCA|nr:hypothetical protein [Nocardia tenerifensis]PXX58782.1 hypothetical protein DFR70_113117 [Nocardia tenerifensis]
MRFRPARIATLTVLFIAAAAGLSALASAAFAEESWTYVCDEIEEPGGVGAQGSGNCQANDGAPETGPIGRKFKLHQRGVQPKPETVAVCEGASGGAYGEASVPARVDGFGCYVYEVG